MSKTVTGADMNKYIINTDSIMPFTPKLREKPKQGLVRTHDMSHDFESFALLFIQKQDGQSRMRQGWQLPFSFF